MSMEWKAGDWVVFNLKIGQIKEIRDNGSAVFSDGACETSGRLVDRFRPLTLRNKRAVESFDYYYDMLRDMDGSAGFNFPDINRYFCDLALEAIDAPTEDSAKPAFEKAQAFVHAARDYEKVIDGVRLFRPK